LTCIDICIDIKEWDVLTKKMISFRIDTNLLDRLNDLGESKTDVIQKALEMYLQPSKDVNTLHKESVNTKRNTTVNTVDQVNHKIQVIENYELMEYLKRDHEWLKDRICLLYTSPSPRD